MKRVKEEQTLEEHGFLMKFDLSKTTGGALLIVQDMWNQNIKKEILKVVYKVQIARIIQTPQDETT